MSQIRAARSPPPVPAPAAPAAPTRADFEGRIAGDGSDRQVFASDTAAQDTPLGRGLRAQADQQLVGPPSAENQFDAGLFRFANAAALNVPRNMMAGAEALRSGKSFGDSYRYVQDVEEALARQNPKTALAGTVGGVVGGAVTLPAIGSAARLGRVGQAALTGGVYGAAGELADSKDLGQAAIAGGVGGTLGGAGGYAIDKLVPIVAPVISRMIGRGVPFRDAAGNVTAEGQAALREVGVDAAQIPQDVMAQIEQAFAAKGASPAVAREALAGEFNVPLSRAQATLDPRAAMLEQGAAAGTRGGKAEEIARGFAGRQAEAIDAARGGFPGMAPRGSPTVDNPAAASEAVADRARQAFADHTFDVAAAQRAQDDALRLARGRAPDDALDAAQTAAGAIRDAAGQSRQGYRDAYAAVGAIPGEFRPGAFTSVGERARADLGPSMPVDPVVTPQTAKALADLDNLPRLLAKPDGSGPTPADTETFRRRLLAYRSAVDPRNATDRMGVDSAIRSYTNHLEGAEGAGLFGPRQAAGPANSAADGLPRSPATVAAPEANSAAGGAATREAASISRPVASPSDFVPFDGPTAVAGSDALPGGSTELTTALKNARGLFREHVQAFKPRGPGDDAGRLMQQIVEGDMTPAEIARGMFGSATRPGEAGLSTRFATRLRQAMGDDSPALDAVRQGLIAHALDGNGTGDVGRRLDVLLRHGGRDAANAILTPEQRGALGAFRAALYETERRQQAVPEWLTGLARKDFDPNAVTADLFGSGVPGTRIGAAAYARGLKGFLGEGSQEWAGVRQAAVSRLLRPDGRDLSPTQEADRIRAFVQGDGAKFAEHLFDAGERAKMLRYAAVLRSTDATKGIAAPDDGRRNMVAHLLNGILGAVAFKAGAPTAAAAPFTAKVGQRVVIGGPGAFMASRSFSGGAPRALAPLPPPALDQLGVGIGLAAGQR